MKLRFSAGKILLGRKSLSNNPGKILSIVPDNIETLSYLADFRIAIYHFDWIINSTMRLSMISSIIKASVCGINRAKGFGG